MKTKCSNCSKNFWKKRENHLYCCNSCRSKAYRRRKGIPEPSFLSGSKDGSIGDCKPCKTKASIRSFDVSLSATQSTIHKLQNDIYYWQNVITTADKGQFPIWTIALAGGGFTMGESEASKLAYLLLGGVIGNAMDKQVADPTRIKVNARKQISLIKSTIRSLKQEQKEQELRATPNGIYSASQVLNITNEVYHFHKPFTVLGHPQKNFSMMIYGVPDSGKSHFAMRMAAYTKKYHGSTLFVSAEEGTSKRYQDKVSNYEYLGDVLPDASGINSIYTGMKGRKYDFVFLDSINRLRIEANELRQLRKDFPNTAFIYILQSTKDNKYKGSREIEHDTEIKAFVESGTANITGKYGAGTFEIFGTNKVRSIKRSGSRRNLSS